MARHGEHTVLTAVAVMLVWHAARLGSRINAVRRR